MAGKRPINADLPPVETEAEAPESSPTPVKPPPPPKRRRKPVPAALKAIAGLVLVAVVFLVAAVLGGGGTNEGPSHRRPRRSHHPRRSSRRRRPPPRRPRSWAIRRSPPTTRPGSAAPIPATTAAAVSLAVFPSTTTGQRPAAVTLVDESDWQGATAAAVLMAAPVEAPLLVSSAGGLPDATSQALAALDPQGSLQTGGTQAFAIGEASPPDDLKAELVKAGDPAAVAAAIATLRDKLIDAPPSHVVLAPEADPGFAAPAAAWAARSGDPVLFTGTERLPAATVQALKRHPKVPVYVLGPSSVIPSSVVREVAETAKRVRRVSGETPVENAIALARYASGDFGWNVNDPGHGFVVARSDAPLDAAVSAPLSASGTWGPLLLSDDAGTLPAALREYLLDVKPGYTTDPTRAFYNHVWVIGDQEAIDVNQQAEINQLAELAKIGGGEP